MIVGENINFCNAKLKMIDVYRNDSIVDIEINNINGCITKIKAVDKIFAEEIVKRFNNYAEPKQLKLF